MANSQILVAITGVVCSGKSFLGKIIAKLGYKVFSCDDEIHEILEEVAIVKKISAAFPEVICNIPTAVHPPASSQRRLGSSACTSEGWDPNAVHKDGSSGQAREQGLDPSLRWDDAKWGGSGVAGINRKLLAGIIFKDPKARQRLEDILYPKLFARQDKFIAKLKRTKSAIGFFEVPLLYEKKLESQYDHVIVTTAPKGVLKKRAIERKIDLKVFSNILKTQIASEEKEAMANYVIDTNISSLELKKKIKAIIGEIFECHAEK